MHNGLPCNVFIIESRCSSCHQHERGGDRGFGQADRIGHPMADGRWPMPSWPIRSTAISHTLNGQTMVELKLELRSTCNINLNINISNSTVVMQISLRQLVLAAAAAPAQFEFEFSGGGGGGAHSMAASPGKPTDRPSIRQLTSLLHCITLNSFWQIQQPASPTTWPV